MWHVLPLEGQTPSVKVIFAQEKQLILASDCRCLTTLANERQSPYDESATTTTQERDDLGQADG